MIKRLMALAWRPSSAPRASKAKPKPIDNPLADVELTRLGLMWMDDEITSDAYYEEFHIRAKEERLMEEGQLPELRMTRQRIATLKALYDTQRPLSATEIADGVDGVREQVVTHFKIFTDRGWLQEDTSIPVRRAAHQRYTLTEHGRVYVKTLLTLWDVD